MLTKILDFGQLVLWRTMWVRPRQALCDVGRTPARASVVAGGASGCIGFLVSRVRTYRFGSRCLSVERRSGRSRLVTPRLRASEARMYRGCACARQEAHVSKDAFNGPFGFAPASSFPCAVRLPCSPAGQRALASRLGPAAWSAIHGLRSGHTLGLTFGFLTRSWPPAGWASAACLPSPPDPEAAAALGAFRAASAPVCPTTTASYSSWLWSCSSARGEQQSVGLWRGLRSAQLARQQAGWVPVQGALACASCLSCPAMWLC